MNDEKYLQVIKKIFPAISEEQIEVFDDGWDFVVFLVNKKMTFRFPRRKYYADKLPAEVDFITKFKKLSPVPIPNLKLHADKTLKFPYVTYPFISGVQFKKELAGTFSQEELLTIAKQLAYFLSALHSFPLEKIKALRKYGLEGLKAWQNRLKKIKQKVFPFISTSEQQWIEKIFNNFFAVMKKSNIKLCVTHSDIMPEHIIVDPHKHTLSGIIDFGDISIGDPALDFTFLNKYGKDFLDKVYDEYKLITDEYFETRRQFYEDRLVVTNLEHVIGLKDKKKILIHKKQLSDYVVVHHF
ncbi:aminoglycoside phosphotransferase family protein [Candidatus Gottesmanbacteria bacterium]|nr:aminoglycoside phosphotransferase family protein [Candidatus Gottesmanbacteria bacterium]